jgi:hypothetical protein
MPLSVDAAVENEAVDTPILRDAPVNRAITAAAQAVHATLEGLGTPFLPLQPAHFAKPRDALRRRRVVERKPSDAAPFAVNPARSNPLVHHAASPDSRRRKSLSSPCAPSRSVALRKTSARCILAPNRFTPSRSRVSLEDAARDHSLRAPCPDRLPPRPDADTFQDLDRGAVRPVRSSTWEGKHRGLCPSPITESDHIARSAEWAAERPSSPLPGRATLGPQQRLTRDWRRELGAEEGCGNGARLPDVQGA